MALGKKKKKKTVSAKKNCHREFPRAAVSGRVYIHDEEHLFIAPLANISAGGLFIADLIDIPRGREVKIVVKSPSLNRPIQVGGNVVRIEKASSKEQRKGLAVQFSEISLEQRQTIQNAVERVQEAEASEMAMVA